MEETKISLIAGFVMGMIAAFLVIAILSHAGIFSSDNSLNVLVKNFCREKGYDTGMYARIPQGIEITCMLERSDVKTKMSYVVMNDKIFAWIF